MALQTLKRAADYAGLGKDALGLYSSSEQVRRRANEHICLRMGKLRGLPQKVGQMLSFSNADEDANSQDYAALQESAEPLPWEDIRPLLEQEWGKCVDDVLATVDRRGIAASLGQVHRGTLLDGREVAIKLQYPGIEQAVKTDLKALGLLSIPLGNLKRGFDLAGYREAIGEDMRQELDYTQEADHQRALYQSTLNDDSLVVPGVIDELSGQTVLVSCWEEGDHWNEVRKNWTTLEKRRLATTLLGLFLRGLLQNGLMQADWHPGNVRFRRSESDSQLVLYDFGCMCQPSDEQRIALARLMQATIEGSESPYRLLLAIGFDPEYLEPLADKLPAVCRVLFEPFCMERHYAPADWKLGERVGGILGDDRWNLRIAGPPNFVFVLRAFHGITHYLQGLGVSFDWRTQFENAVAPVLPLFDSLALPTDDTASDFRTVAKHLVIRVSNKGRTTVQLTQMAACIERLDELLDDELKQRIVDEGIDLDAIVAEVRQRGYAPGSVFQLTGGEKQVEVKLE